MFSRILQCLSIMLLLHSLARADICIGKKAGSCVNSLGECMHEDVRTGVCLEGTSPRSTATTNFESILPTDFVMSTFRFPHILIRRSHDDRETQDRVRVAIAKFLQTQKHAIPENLTWSDIHFTHWHYVIDSRINNNSCEDGIMSINEDAIDCGGPCRPCEQVCFRLQDTAFSKNSSLTLSLETPKMSESGTSDVSASNMVFRSKKGIVATQSSKFEQHFQFYVDDIDNQKPVSVFAEICLFCGLDDNIRGEGKYCTSYNSFSLDEHDGYQLYVETSNWGVQRRSGIPCPFLDNGQVVVRVWSQSSEPFKLNLKNSSICLPYVAPGDAALPSSRRVLFTDMHKKKAVEMEIAFKAAKDHVQNLRRLFRLAELDNTLYFYLRQEGVEPIGVKAMTENITESKLSGNCVSVHENATDEWCSNLCRSTPNFCVSTLCFCENPSEQVATYGEDMGLILVPASSLCSTAKLRDCFGVFGASGGIFIIFLSILFSSGVLAALRRARKLSKFVSNKSTGSSDHELRDIEEASKGNEQLTLRVIQDFTAFSEDEISLVCGEIVYGAKASGFLYSGGNKSKTGFFPSTAVETIEPRLHSASTSEEPSIHFAATAQANPFLRLLLSIISFVLLVFSAVNFMWLSSSGHQKAYPASSFASTFVSIYAVALALGLVGFMFYTKKMDIFLGASKKIGVDLNGVILCLVSTGLFFSVPTIIPGLLLFMTGILQIAIFFHQELTLKTGAQYYFSRESLVSSSVLWLREFSCTNNSWTSLRAMKLSAAGIAMCLGIYGICKWNTIIHEQSESAFDCSTRLAREDNPEPCTLVHFSRWVLLPKAFGYMLLFFTAIVILPTPRALIHLLQQHTRFKAIYTHTREEHRTMTWHQWIWGSIIVASVVHILGHFTHFQDAPDSTIHFFHVHIFLSGLAVTTALFLTYVTTQLQEKSSRASSLYTRWKKYSHVVFFIVLMLHARPFLYYAIIPIIIYAAEMFLRRRCQQRVECVEVQQHDEWGVEICLRIFNPTTIFRPGDYICLSLKPSKRRQDRSFCLTATKESPDTRRVELSIHLPLALGTKYKHVLNSCETVRLNDIDLPTLEIAKQCWELRRYNSSNSDIVRVEGGYRTPYSYFNLYDHCILVFDGINIDASLSILEYAISRWQGQSQSHEVSVIQMYWIIQQHEVAGCRWLLQRLCEAQMKLLLLRQQHRISSDKFFEMNVYITNTLVNPEPAPSLSSRLKAGIAFGPCSWKDVMEEIMCPRQVSTLQTKLQVRDSTNTATENPCNRIHEIWVWHGLPQWKAILNTVERSRLQQKKFGQQSDIGICYEGSREHFTPLFDALVAANRNSDEDEEIQLQYHCW